MSATAFAIALAAIVTAQAGAGPLAPGKVHTFTLSKDVKLLRQSNIPRDWDDHIDASARIGVYLPASHKAGAKLSALVIFGAQGNNIGALGQYTVFADELSLLLVSPQSGRAEHDDRANYYYTLSAIEHLKKEGYLSPRSNVVVAGFSGGAKMALAVGVYGGSAFDGVLAVGCNVDLASKAYGWLGERSALSMPIVLLNATDDSVVAGATDAVAASMQNTGFRNVRLSTYTGGHVIPRSETLRALRTLVR